MAAAGEPAGGRRFALLVGCTEYDNNRAFRLVGPGNDVELFRQLLVGKFAFSPANIVVLAEQRGGQLRPTHANIAREFADLAAKVRAGDQVVILLGGHGSQQPEQDPPDPNYPKPDGRDQIFLPADVGVWRGGKEHTVTNAIPDYELRKWTKAITATGASLWLIVDSCCSGATLRGGETVRKVAPAALGISDEAFAAAADHAKLRGGTRGGDASEPRYDLDQQSPNFVALYAARPDEPTLEIPLPGDSDDAKVHGLLTYTLCEILERASGDLTYVELQTLIANRYVQMGRSMFPKPLVEGLARDRQVLGTRVPGRSQFNLVADPAGGWKLNAGKLQGLAQGCVLTVYPPRDRPNAEQPIGHVRIRRADTLDATVVPCEYDGEPAPSQADLSPGARCELAYLDYGPMRLRLAVDKIIAESVDKGIADPVDTRSNPGTERSTAAELSVRLAEIDKDLRELAKKPDAVFRVVEAGDKPDWVVQARKGELALVPADVANIQGALPPQAPRFLLPRQQIGKALEEYAHRIFRAQNLLKLTAPSTELPHPAIGADGLVQDDSAISVEVEMLKFRDADDRRGTPLHSAGAELTIPSGQSVGWRITNRSRFKVDVTLLFVDSEYGIIAVFPRAGSAADNMIPPGGHIITMRATTTPTTFDLDQIVTIAVKSGGQPIDFSILEQTNLEAVRKSLRGAGDPTLDTPLGQLFQHALYGSGDTRGLSLDTTAETQEMSLMSWRVK